MSGGLGRGANAGDELAARAIPHLSRGLPGDTVLGVENSARGNFRIPRSNPSRSEVGELSAFLLDRRVNERYDGRLLTPWEVPVVPAYPKLCKWDQPFKRLDLKLKTNVV